MWNKWVWVVKRVRGKVVFVNRRCSSGVFSVVYYFVVFVFIGNGIWFFDGLDMELGYICDIENFDNWLIDI